MIAPITWVPGVTLEQIEEQIIKKALSHYKGNKTATANALGVSTRTIDNKLDKYAESDKELEKVLLAKKMKDEEYLARARGIAPPKVEPVAVTVQVTKLRK